MLTKVLKNLTNNKEIVYQLGGFDIRAVILAAGRGVRIGPLTDVVPKALLYCAGMTLIERLISTLRAVGITQITVGVGWKSSFIKEHVYSLGLEDRISLIEVPNYQRGALQTLLSVLDTFSDGPFLVTPSDCVVDEHIVSQTIRSHTSSEKGQVITLSVDENASNGSIVSANDQGFITGIGDLPKASIRIGRSAMVLVSERDVIPSFRTSLDTGENRVSDAINNLIIDGLPVKSAIVDGSWMDIDTLDSLLKANSELLSRPGFDKADFIQVSPGDELEVGDAIKMKTGTVLNRGVHLIGPVRIAPNCLIGASSIIGPFVSMDINTNIEERCTISNSILFGKAKVSSENKFEQTVVFGNSMHRGGL
ncbi:MAG: sugar phosphate nucleotidyltransferase [Candidatus Thorarchaeota archaeon]